MATLYELSDEFAALLELAEDPDIDEETLRDTMEAIEGDFNDKLDNYSRVIRTLKASAKACTDEAKRLSDRARSMHNNADRMTRFMQSMMEKVGKKKVKTDYFTYSIQWNPESVFIPDESKVPEKFLRQKTEVDKAAVKKALNEGEIFDWATLQRTEGLRIR